MTKRIHQDYFKRETAEVAQFVDNLKDNAVKAGTFDSAAAADFIATASNQNSGVKVPETLQVVLDEAKGDAEWYANPALVKNCFSQVPSIQKNIELIYGPSIAQPKQAFEP